MPTPDKETERAALAAALENLPPATQSRGSHGHEAATEKARGAQLLEWKAAGWTYQEMADEGGYSDRSNARHALMRALDRHEAENVVQLRTIENEAYRADQKVLREIIADTSIDVNVRLRAIDTRTRSAARNARLNGTDAPVKMELSAGVAAQLGDALAELEEAVLPDTVRGEVVPDGDDDDGTGPAD